MVSRSVRTEQNLLIPPWEERPIAALLHGLGWVPIWGFLVSAVVWLIWKQRSRQLVFHVQQTIQLQIFVLLGVIAWSVGTIISNVIGGLFPAIGEGLGTLVDFLAILALTVACLVALFAALEVYRGRPYLYPLFGRRVLDASFRKLNEA
jgi:uncharacterized Tic20 family protein